MDRSTFSLITLFILLFSSLSGGHDLAFDSKEEVILTSELEPISTIAGCVNLESGSFFVSECDLSLGLPSHPLSFSRTYDSKLRMESMLGEGCGTNIATTIDYLNHVKSGQYITYLEFNREGARVSLKAGHAQEVDGKKRLDFKFSSSKLPEKVTNLKEKAVLSVPATVFPPPILSEEKSLSHKRSSPTRTEQGGHIKPSSQSFITTTS